MISTITCVFAVSLFHILSTPLSYFHQLIEEFSRLSASVPRGQFIGSTNDVEPHLSSFLTSWSKVRSQSSTTFGCATDLVRRLKDTEKSAKSAGLALDYSIARESIEGRLEEVKVVEKKVTEICLKREKRWKLSLQFDQLGPSVDKVGLYRHVHGTVNRLCGMQKRPLPYTLVMLTSPYCVYSI